MVNLIKNIENDSINIDEFNELFDKTLKPFRSENARLVFKIIYDKKPIKLTTLDMQNLLLEYQQQLSKKELHNWLIGLMNSGYLEKATERGKPTLIPYKDKYTFDLWKTTEKGDEILNKLTIFFENYHSEDKKKLISQPLFIPNYETLTLFDFQKIKEIFYTTNLLLKLSKFNKKISIKILSNLLKIDFQVLVKEIKNHVKFSKPKLFYLEKKSLGIKDIILKLLGVKYHQDFFVSLTEEGENMAKGLINTFYSN